MERMRLGMCDVSRRGRVDQCRVLIGWDGGNGVGRMGWGKSGVGRMGWGRCCLDRMGWDKWDVLVEWNG